MTMIIACCVFALSLAIGQLMFKFAAGDIVAARSWAAALASPWLIGALVFYGGATALWVWILTQMPLSRAYPYALLSTVMVPLLARVVLGEPLPALYVAGLAMAVGGLALIHFS